MTGSSMVKFPFQLTTLRNKNFVNLWNIRYAFTKYEIEMAFRDQATTAMLWRGEIITALCPLNFDRAFAEFDLVINLIVGHEV